MYRVLNCLTVDHDYRLVFLAALVCAVAAVTAFSIYERARHSSDGKRLGWHFLTGVAAGAGIWATHFVAMLAYDPGLPTAYEPALTVISLLIAIMVTTSGFALAAPARSRLVVGAGGALIGAGISAMHYTGMRALQLPGTIQWDSELVVASVLFGIGLGALSTLTHAAIKGSRGAVAAGAGLFTLAICTMHFTAMGAVTILPDPTIAVVPSLMDNSMMAFAVAGVTLLVMLSGLSAALIDRQTSKESLQRVLELADATIEGVLTARDGRIVNANRRVTELCGFTARELAGKPVFDGLLHLRKNAAAPGEEAQEALIVSAEGDALPVEVMRRPFVNGVRANEVYAIRDMREQRAAEARIRYLAHFDALTGLPNRAALNQQLAGILEESKAEGRRFAVLCIDLDRFKDVNDVLGHAAGDRVLGEAARRMSETLRAGEYIGRVGGDEFIVLQTAGNQPEAASNLAARLVGQFERQFEVDNQLNQLGLSIGIAIYPGDGEAMEELVANADIALYRAKSDGRGRACFFEPEMDAAQRRRRRLAQALHKALANNQFEVVYQPQVRIPTGELIGFEALLRWRHPEHGTISPTEFIPIAEETGLIVPIGEWVLRTACVEAAAWDKPYRIAVNLSPKQFQQGDLARLVHGILLESGLPASRLELEITESTLIQDQQRALDVLRRLKALGIKVAMDDFGTGYSSLSTLQAFPFDKIKIDRSFVHELGQRKEAATIVKSVLGLGRSLEIPVLAEGVETAGQLDWLNSEQCNEVQGYLFGKPVARDRIHAIISEGLSAASGGRAAEEAALPAAPTRPAVA